MGKMTKRYKLKLKVFMKIAETIAKLSTCPKARVGAVIVKDNRVISMGFNGAPIGEPHCDDVGCLIHKGHCVRTVHAEMNALLTAARFGVRLDGATMICTHEPCDKCIKACINAGIKMVFYKKDYPNKLNKPYKKYMMKIGGII